MNTYTPLNLVSPKQNINLLKVPDTRTPSLEYAALALNFMTDFSRTAMISVLATVQIDEALNKMINSGIRLLFVVDLENSILGSISSYDIEGEKPIIYLQSRDGRIGNYSRGDIMVQDIMAPGSQWRLLNYGNLSNATVGNIVRTFKDLGQRHLIVAEAIHRGNAQIVRGLFSASIIENALAITIDVLETAKSFSEIKQKLVPN